jgi:predicted amidohydrolase
VNVAAVQYRADRADLDRSRRSLAALARRAAAGSDLVVLPEMAVSGYLFANRDDARRIAELPRGDTFAALSPIAAEHRCWMVCGFAESAGDRLFNSALVIDPTGALAFTYRKTLLFEADVCWATPGDSGYFRFELDDAAVGVGICMDLNDDAFLSWANDADLDAIAFPTNWVEEGVAVWPYWQLRLAATRAVLVAGNTWGLEKAAGTALGFCGRSAILDRRTVLAGLGPAGNGAIRAFIPRRSRPRPLSPPR